MSYAVLGTPNRLEYDQGFFVKGGDGLADVKPIAHLYKRQVYQLAEYLGVPEAVRSRPPTTDTYPLAQTQEEFFFSLPLQELDLMLRARNEGRSAAAAGLELGYRPEQIKRAYREISHKRRVTRHLHFPPLLVEAVPEVDAEIARGNFSGLMGWLRQNVHAQGARVSAPELLKLSTGKPLAATSTLRYLEAKYLGNESAVGSAAA